MTANTDPAMIAMGLSEGQQTCGDVLDRLPCLRCGATSLRQCTLSYWGRAEATHIINNTPGLYQKLITANDRRRTILKETTSDQG